MADSEVFSGGTPPSDRGLETTASLLARVRAGEPGATERLSARYLPLLQRWAHGRLPRHARDLLDTDDLVQTTLIRALDQVQGFEPRREGAFLAYLRRILRNQILDEIRRMGRRPGHEALPDNHPDPGTSPLETAIGTETLEAYDRALATLGDEQQEAIVMRVELGFTYEQIAGALGIPSANAARMAVSRALVRLAEAMNAR